MNNPAVFFTVLALAITLPSLAIIRLFDAIDRRNRPWREP